MDELIDYVSRLMQYIEKNGSRLNPETQRALAEFLEQAFEIIETMGGEQSPVEGLQPSGGVPQLEPGPYPSSNVNAFRYNPQTQQLFVKFHGKDSAGSGPTYEYAQIPAYIYDVFSRGAIGPKTSGQNKYHRWIKNRTPSLGGTLNALIKAGNFPYKKVA